MEGNVTKVSEKVASEPVHLKSMIVPLSITAWIFKDVSVSIPLLTSVNRGAKVLVQILCSGWLIDPSEASLVLRSTGVQPFESVSEDRYLLMASRMRSTCNAV